MVETLPSSSPSELPSSTSFDFTCVNVLEGHTRAVSSVKHSPDGHTLATACESHRSKLFLARVCKFDTGCFTVKLVTDLLMLILVTTLWHLLAADATLRIWDASSGASKATLKGHTEGLSDVAWSVDGLFLASASDDKSVRLWDVEAETSVLKLEGHSSYVMCANFNPQANLLVTGSFDENVRL